MSLDQSLTELQFTVSGRISRPCAEVYEAVADPAQLSKYFTTGGATGRLETGTVATWDFHDHPGRVPGDGRRGGAERTDRDPLGRSGDHRPVRHDDHDVRVRTGRRRARTLVTITESSWKATPTGAERAFGNCTGWTGMLAAMKVWLEHGINLRDGFYA